MDTHFYVLPDETLSDFHTKNISVKWIKAYQDRTPSERQMESTQEGTLGDWFKITVSILTKCRECAGEIDQGELCCFHVEMLGTLLGIGGVNIIDYQRGRFREA